MKHLKHKWSGWLLTAEFINVVMIIKTQRNLTVPVLTDRHHEARLAFAIEYQKWQVHHWCPVLFTDESSLVLSDVTDMKTPGEAVENDMLPVTFCVDACSMIMGKEIPESWFCSSGHGLKSQDVPKFTDHIIPGLQTHQVPQGGYEKWQKWQWHEGHIKDDVYHEPTHTDQYF